MNADTFGEVKRREELKRERAWDPALRWQVLQETITWAETQGTVRRNTPKAALAAQDRLRRGLVRPDRGRLDAKALGALPLPTAQDGGDILDALLSEREEGR